MNAETPDHTDGGQQNSTCPPPLFHGYAGFWERYAAAFIDGVILSVAGVLMGGVVDVPRTTGIQAIVAVMFWLYFALFESSPMQATPGKMAVGIKVTGMDGNRISFGRASGRHFSKILSALICLAGYVMAAFTQKRQGLHDIIAGCLIVNKGAPTRSKTIIISAASTAFIVGTIVLFMIFPSILCPGRRNIVLQANMAAMGTRAKDICVAIAAANTEREPLGLGPVWPRTGNPVEGADGIDKMTFKNSSDYFTVLYDGENFGTADWAPYVSGFDYTKCAGAGVPVAAQEHRLTAENNAWTIAANVTDDMPELIPLIITRNVDPASLIPKEGDLRKQLIRPSEKFKIPFGKHGFVMVRKGGAVFKCTWRYANLAVLYQSASEEELQKIRDAFQKVEYLEP